MVGTTGSGKTTMGARLSRLLGCPHLELDSYHWGPNWTPRETETFRAEVGSAVSADRWVADGNYHVVRDLVWGRADTLVWLDYSIGTVLLRLIRRTARRVGTREELWQGNREQLWVHLATRDSLFLWALKTHWRRRRKYEELLTRGDFPHLEVKRFYSPAEAEKWLENLAATNRAEEAVRPR